MTLPPLSYDLPKSSTFNDAFCYKSRAFQYENEVRFIAGELGTSPEVEQLNAPRRQFHGVDIDASVLIEEIRTSPYSPGWVVDMIRTLVSRLNVNAIVQKSDFYDTFHTPKISFIPEFAYGWHENVKPKGLWRKIPLTKGGYEYARIEKRGIRTETEQ